MKQNKISAAIKIYLILSVPIVAHSQTENEGANTQPLIVSESANVSSVSQQAQALNFWTREKIATAPAMPLMVDTGSSKVDSISANRESTPGPAGRVAGGKATDDTELFHQKAYPQDWQVNRKNYGSKYKDGLSAAGEGSSNTTKAIFAAGTSTVHTNYAVNIKTALWKLYPHRWMGKFTFRTPRGNSSCSATVIKNNHIVTAAHCVYDTPSRNRWYTNKAFTPAYRNGQAPYGTFPTTGCSVLTAWVNHSGSYSINTWARNDLAVCKMGRNSAGRTINQAVGWSGYGWNWNYNQLHFNSGYPARLYNDALLLSGPGQYLRSCTAESFRHTTNTLGMGCLFGRGISGGSWLRHYKPNYVSGSVNSVNSGLYIGQKNLYGARFITGNIKTLCNASGC